MNQRCKSAYKQPKIVPNLNAPKPKPEWNSEYTENPHKLSRAELLQRKLNSKSKNESQAKEELQHKLEMLKSGIIPKEYKTVT